MGNRVGILTFQNANNYGAALQAFALQSYLRGKGYDCTIINYRAKAIYQMHSFRRLSREKTLRCNIRDMIWNIVFLPRRLSFYTFRKQWRMTPEFDSSNIREVNERFDKFIVGSDQVFNLKLTKNDLTFYLDFAEEGKCKCSYAASMGKIDFSCSHIYRRYLSRFNYLSVREASTAAEICQVVGKDCEAVPDPVFLLTQREWREQLQIKPLQQRGYILVYALNKDEKLLLYAQRAAEIYHYSLVIITRELRMHIQGVRIIRNAGPRRFLQLLASAALVIGNSFHGAALSLVFHKQFFVSIPQSIDQNANRITDLLEIVCLRDRILREDTDMFRQIDYTVVEKYIEAYSQIGKDYLERIMLEQ